MTQTSTTPQTVTFRADFSKNLTGIIFDVEGERTDANGRAFYLVRTVRRGRTVRRTAWVSDVIPA